MLAHLDNFRGTHDQEAIFHVLRTVLCLTMPIDPALIQTGIMNVEQQQDGHSCGKHVVQMLAGAGKESEGLDRCFREDGLRYIASLEQVQSFDVLFPMYLSGKLPGPPMNNIGMGDLARRAAVGHGDGGMARQEMQGTDARKLTTTVYDSVVGAQVKAEEGCIVAPTLKTAEFQQCILVLP
ncbi:hypothetical protein R1flu_022779 [Riccia fluitans]|uniref:Ubiquitinyl hydrolase 1 n=1 Tax=Riccia fluitans TaxID=41844 RepID=A0ABD1XQ60_9MARC